MPVPSAEKALLHDQGLRRCSRCEHVLSESEFNKNSKDRFGLARWCRQCNKERCVDWAKDNSAVAVARAAAWNSANTDRRREISLHAFHRRRARVAGSGEFTVSKSDLDGLRTRPCYHCGAPSEHIDHVIPISRGGSHGIGNLGPMCAPCNLRKNAKTYAEFRYGR
jgi:5-methylcytosine-specific restriction endonuclease McrA